MLILRLNPLNFNHAQFNAVAEQLVNERTLRIDCPSLLNNEQAHGETTKSQHQRYGIAVNTLSHECFRVPVLRVRCCTRSWPSTGHLRNIVAIVMPACRC